MTDTKPNRLIGNASEGADWSSAFSRTAPLTGDEKAKLKDALVRAKRADDAAAVDYLRRAMDDPDAARRVLDGGTGEGGCEGESKVGKAAVTVKDAGVGSPYSPPAIEFADPAPYGYCPECRTPGVMAERRLNGNAHCANGHAYPRAKAKYASTQVELTGAARDKLLAMAAKLADADLGEDGREDNPHVTVRYGLHVDGVEPVAAVLRGGEFGPVKVSLGMLGAFRGAGSGRDYDVIYATVDSPDLRRLNEALAVLPHTDTHATYTPHATVGYVKAGLADKYLRELGAVDEVAVVDRVVFSTAAREVTEVVLGGGTREGGVGVGVKSHGPPPFAGAVFNEQSHRWEKPSTAGGGKHGAVEIAAHDHLSKQAIQGNRAAIQGDEDKVRRVADRAVLRIKQAYKNEWGHIREQVAAKYGPAAANDPGMADVRRALNDGMRAALKSVDAIQEDQLAGLKKGRGRESAHFDHDDELADARKHQTAAAEKAYNLLALVVAGHTTKPTTGKGMRDVIKSHGTPPFPGAVFNESSHRWEKPAAGSGNKPTSGKPRQPSATAGLTAAIHEHDSAPEGSLAKRALDAHLSNLLGVDELGQPSKVKPTAKDTAVALTSAFVEAHRLKGTPEDLAPIERAMHALGMRKVGVQGESIAFDPKLMQQAEGEQAVAAGTPVKVSRPGWTLPDAGGGGAGGGGGGGELRIAPAVVTRAR